MIEILSIMAYPNDDEARKKLLANISSKGLGDAELDKELREGLGEVFSKLGGIPVLHDSPEYKEIIKQYSLNTYKGHIAGLILHYIWRIEASNVQSGASVKKAIFLVVEYFKEIKEETTAWQDYPFNEKFIKELWSDFKPVSHLWAAFVQWGMWGRPSEYSPSEPSGIRGFISLAKKFKEFGTTHLPRARTSPTLSIEETWSPPEDFEYMDFEFKIPPLSQQELDVLGNYQAPQSL